jgi:hypothetical protein
MIQKLVSMKLRKKKNVYCQKNSELRRLAGAMHCQIWVTRSVYMQFEAEDYRKIGFALYDYITLGYSQCSIDIISFNIRNQCSIVKLIHFALWVWKSQFCDDNT